MFSKTVQSVKDKNKKATWTNKVPNNTHGAAFVNEAGTMSVNFTRIHCQTPEGVTCSTFMHYINGPPFLLETENLISFCDFHCLPVP